MRRSLRIVLAGVMALSTLAGQIAEAATCFTLQAELDHLRSQGGGGDRSRYERAFQEQANVLARTEGRARNAGCFGGGFQFFRQRPDRACRTLIPKIRDMQVNLTRLDRLRRRGGGGSLRRMRLLQAAIAERGCGIPGHDQWEEADRNEDMLDLGTQFSGRGTYRTLCVRTCDGYYFPISFSTTPAQFGNDAQTCAAMCPGAEASLFYHRNPGGGPEEMVSLDERRYTELPTAFQYRQSLSPSCSCRPAGGFPAIASIPVGDVSAEESPAPPALLPRPRPAPGEDPETLANRAGGFTPRAAAAEGAALASGEGIDGRPVRVVGPAYWDDKQQDGALIAPVPN